MQRIAIAIVLMAACEPRPVAPPAPPIATRPPPAPPIVDAAPAPDAAAATADEPPQDDTPPGPCPGAIVDGDLQIDGAVAIAHATRIGEHDGAALYGSEQALWRVDCRQTPPAQRLIDLAPGAELASAHLTRTGNVLFADGTGIAALSLATRATRTVYTTPPTPITHWLACAAMPPPKGEPYRVAQSVDGLLGLDDNDTTLVLYRFGAHCHAPGGFELRVTDFADPRRRREHVARPIAAVAVSARGDVWMADGGGLWRSRDRGATWRAVPLTLPPVYDGFPEGIAQILVDRTGRDLIVRTAVPDGVRVGESAMASPGRVARSRDGGRTWTAIPWAKDEPSIDATHVSAADGDHDRITIFLDGWVEGDDSGTRVPTLTTADGGATWQAGAAPRPPAVREATAGQDRYLATRDGLVRITGGVRRTVTGTLAKPYPLDLY